MKSDVTCSSICTRALVAQQWRQKAEAVEDAGYARFGATLRGLADSYDREAERVHADNVGDE